MREGPLSATLWCVVTALDELRVLVLDCQAGGATPAHGDLLSLAWAVSDARGILGEPASHWIRPRSARPITRAVRELTGFDEACLTHALPEGDAWRALAVASDALAESLARRAAPVVIHFARFELAFLRDLHARLSPERAFPFDVLCLHEIAQRLLPDLPRRNIRALAGHLGHSTDLVRDARGHVLASAFIWRAFLPMLAERSVRTWQELEDWLAASPRPARPARRRYPLEAALRRALPERPGVYRFVRRNRDVLYVGKAASLKARVASHFAGHARESERSLEMLTQVADIDFSETPSVLEAALLECDEIKRLDPPYNIQLRESERYAWFAARDLRAVKTERDAAHPLGPLPSRFALAPLAALIALLAEGSFAPRAVADALTVPPAFLPDESLFREGFALFRAEHLDGRGGDAARRVDAAARSLWRARRRSEPPAAGDEAASDLWDLARVRRRLERNLIQAGLILRRARWLRLLADADVAFRERAMADARALLLSRGEIVARHTLGREADFERIAPRARAGGPACALDIAAYDRLRVLATELRRVRDEGGDVSVRFRHHSFRDERFSRLTRDV